ncbi:hypothetical protein [Dictyobacter formicarum]|uniref:Uncharacterized protein n=1 Tax=Dictyobacter formicarum TaxID=2778368 RepID=A0ABQ3VKP4_9CHLR|nr:hypothetical protein [Dictyobacter formicarum]GHO85961.1 hypothetical protein KSZ_39670 [Dictyobacter formicarum]
MLQNSTPTPPERSTPLPAQPQQPQPAAPFYQEQHGYPGYSPLPTQSPSTGKIALKYGLIFGAILVARLIIGYVFTLLFNQAIPQIRATYHLPVSTIAIYSFLLTAFFTFLDWIIYFLAGLFAARQTRKISPAVFACLWANLCYSVVSCLLTGISLVYTMSIFAGRSALIASYLTSAGINFAVVLILLHIGLGTGIGALGGLLGKNIAPRQTPYFTR